MGFLGMIEQFVLTMHGTGCIIVQMGNLLRAQVQRYPIVSIQVYEAWELGCMQIACRTLAQVSSTQQSWNTHFFLQDS